MCSGIEKPILHVHCHNDRSGVLVSLRVTTWAQTFIYHNQIMAHVEFVRLFGSLPTYFQRGHDDDDEDVDDLSLIHI